MYKNIFTGQKEIWDALKAAASALEDGDNVLAQAIIDGANIALPHGKLLLLAFKKAGTYFLSITFYYKLTLGKRVKNNILDFSCTFVNVVFNKIKNRDMLPRKAIEKVLSYSGSVDLRNSIIPSCTGSNIHSTISRLDKGNLRLGLDM